MGWEYIATVLGVVATSITLVGLLWKKVLRPVLKWRFKLVRAVNELIPNGGKSIRDEVTNIAVTVSDLDRAQQWSGARWLAVLDRSCVPTYECDADGNCIEANDALCEFFGISREQMLKSGWLEGIEPSDRMRTWELWKKAINAGIPYECEYAVRNVRTGKRVNCIATAKPMIGRNGQVIGYHGTVIEASRHEERDRNQ